MTRFFHRVTRPAAQPPGTVEFTGEQHVEQVSIDTTGYDGDTLVVREGVTPAECAESLHSATVTWIDVIGVHDAALIRDLGERFGVHALALEDVVNTHQRPKLDIYGDHLYVVCRMLRFDREANRVHSEQLSLVLGHGFVISFQERPGDVFAPVRKRLQRAHGRLRRGGADYLAYALLDAVIDNYFLVAEAFGETIEDLEEQLLREGHPDPLDDTHRLKRELVLLRRAAWPLREVMSALVRTDSELVATETVPYLRDALDHANQVGDAIETFRDMLASLHELTMAHASNRLNDVMKVLTIFASIFVPLTFVAGVYGMNFAHMPELTWRWSYPLFWVVILMLGGSMVVYFRRKKWF
jgi:magnesium transporter